MLNVDAGTLLRILLLILGVGSLIFTVFALAKKKIMESFSLIWCGVSVMLIVASFLIRPVLLHNYISIASLLLIMFLIFCGLFAAFFVSVRISELMERQMEMAIKISLLTDENETLKKELKELEEKVDALQQEG